VWAEDGCSRRIYLSLTKGQAPTTSHKPLNLSVSMRHEEQQPRVEARGGGYWERRGIWTGPSLIDTSRSPICREPPGEGPLKLAISHKGAPCAGSEASANSGCSILPTRVLSRTHLRVSKYKKGVREGYPMAKSSTPPWGTDSAKEGRKMVLVITIRSTESIDRSCFGRTSSYGRLYAIYSKLGFVHAIGAYSELAPMRTLSSSLMVSNVSREIAGVQRRSRFRISGDTQPLPYWINRGGQAK